MLTALIADGVPLRRAELKARLSDAWPELRVVAEAAHGREAIELAALHEPDVAFLALRMPVRSGVDVASALGVRCRVVFVTDHDEHANAALDDCGIDTLPCPATRERVAAMVARLKASPGTAALDLAALIAKLAGGGEPPLRWIRASQGASMRLFAVDDVLYFRAEDKHTRLVTCDSEALVRKPIRDLHHELDPEAFRQIHRGTIVNLRAIARVDRDSRGEPVIALAGRSETLAVSRSFAHRFKAM